MPHVRRTTLVEVGTSSCSGIIIDTARGYVLTHASVLLPMLMKKTLLVRCLQTARRLDHLHVSDVFPSVKAGLCIYRLSALCCINVSVSVLYVDVDYLMRGWQLLG